MKFHFSALSIHIAIFIVLSAVATSCTESHDQTSGSKAKLSSPALSPRESLQHFQLANKNLDIKLVASEPLVQAPITIEFDAKGRIWVVEMPGFMRDTSGTGQGVRPMGQIAILEDTNHDGVMDQRQVFLDSLVLPRSIALYEDGVLVAAPPKLLFVENDHGSAGDITVIDSSYAVGGNVEHQANGLLRGIDNWIYSANSSKRYREINGKWVIDHTHYRGQWGITQDKYGRLFYNNNSTNLLGDYFLPSLGAWNQNQGHVSGFNELIVSDNRVYPIHPTPGVNRGYRPKVLDDSLRLNHFTAACAPLVFRSGRLGSKYSGNVFVAEPAGNLIKRNILQYDTYRIEGEQAYQGKEFLASDDERFRPVDLMVGPDGALYVVDMYRGIIQSVQYITHYLKNQIEKRQLKLPLNKGRIYKVIPDGANLSVPNLSRKSADELVPFLDSQNGWIRTTAQRLLVDGDKDEAERLLRQKMKGSFSLVGKIHAFWTLEGLGQLEKQDIQYFIQSDKPKLQWHAIAAIVAHMGDLNVNYWYNVANKLFVNKNPQLAPYIAYLTSAIAQYIPQKAHDLLLKLILKYKNNPYVVDAVISGIEDYELRFLRKIQAMDIDTSSVAYHQLHEVVTNIREQQVKSKKEKMVKRFSRGQELYKTYCQGCHGADGGGIRSLGPPLNGSSWVTGDKETLLSIVLFGFKGSVKVGDKIYKPAAQMPSFGQNSQLSNKEVAKIINYVRNAWTNDASLVKASDVKDVLQANKNRTEPFTAKELK